MDVNIDLLSLIPFQRDDKREGGYDSIVVWGFCFLPALSSLWSDHFLSGHGNDIWLQKQPESRFFINQPMCVFKVLFSLRFAYLRVKGDYVSGSRGKWLLLKFSLFFSLNNLPKFLALFLRITWLRDAYDDIRWSPSCMPWCHYSGGVESFQSDMEASQETSRFTLKDPAHWGHWKLCVSKKKKQINLWVPNGSLIPNPSFLSISFPASYFLPILPLCNTCPVSNLLVPFSPLPPPHSANFCPSPFPPVLSAESSLTCSQTFLPLLCYKLEDEGSDRQSGQLEFVWHDSFPLCQRLILPLW